AAARQAAARAATGDAGVAVTSKGEHAGPDRPDRARSSRGGPDARREEGACRRARDRRGTQQTGPAAGQATGGILGRGPYPASVATVSWQLQQAPRRQLERRVENRYNDGMNRIYHNPNCSTSRKTLALLQEKGVDVEVVEYLKNPPSRDELVELLEKMGMKPRELLRKKGDLYKELDLENPKWTDDQILDFMVRHPVLIERPIVVTDKGARLCRPVEKVLEIL